MNHVRKTLLLLLLLGMVLLAPGSPALAKGYESVGVRHAAVHVREAKQQLQEARRVLTATKTYEHLYGINVARWVWLADDVGWPYPEWPTLMMVVDRESGGSPKAQNPSGAAGLLQLMPGWYNGTYYGNMPDFDPHIPRLNLKYGLWGWKVDGWIPWAVL